VHHLLMIMPYHRALVALACAAALTVTAGCAHHRPVTGTATTSSAGEVAASPSPSTSGHWVAKLAPVGDSTSGIRGRAEITPGPNDQSATVVLLLTGLRAGTTYVWHIRRGPCSATEAQGPASEYAPLTVDQQGRATSAGTFPMNTTMGAYHIDVHPVGAPAAACGDLAQAG
jgi:hypothetical protein